jgi:uncharacterized ion transporter superfamily protein YfcC
MATETPPTQTPPSDETAVEQGGGGFKFPTAFTVLLVVLLAVWGLTFIIQPGSYQYVSCDGGSAQPIPGSFEEVESDLTFRDRLYDLWLSPVNGLYGIRESSEPQEPDPALQASAQEVCGEGVPAELVTAPGNTGPYNSGDMAGAVQVFYFVLAIGAFITVTMKTGALDAGIARLTHRFSARPMMLIILLMIIFSVGGTTYGMAEETLGFYVLIVPVMLGLGMDRMTGVATIMVGAGVGTLASTVNPFATGVASDSAGIPLGDGLPSRVVIYLVLVAVAILYVLRYARRVHADPSKSLVPLTDEDRELGGKAGAEEPPPLEGRQSLVLWIFAVTFLVMIFSVIPWSDFSETLDGITLGWYFPELAALFIVASIIVGMVGGLGEQGTVETIISGAGDFLGAALIIAVARGVTVIMNNAQVTDTVLNSLEDLVSDTSSGVFATLMFIVNLPLAFLVPSSSGHAVLAMPILAPLADFAGVGRSIVVTAYQSASGLLNLFTPTSAIVMGGLALAKVRYDRYIRFVAPLLGILFILVCILLVLFAPISDGNFA